MTTSLLPYKNFENVFIYEDDKGHSSEYKLDFSENTQVQRQLIVKDKNEKMVRRVVQLSTVFKGDIIEEYFPLKESDIYRYNFIEDRDEVIGGLSSRSNNLQHPKILVRDESEFGNPIRVGESVEMFGLDGKVTSINRLNTHLGRLPSVTIESYSRSGKVVSKGVFVKGIGIYELTTFNENGSEQSSIRLKEVKPDTRTISLHTSKGDEVEVPLKANANISRSILESFSGYDKLLLEKLLPVENISFFHSDNYNAIIVELSKQDNNLTTNELIEEFSHRLGSYYNNELSNLNSDLEYVEIFYTVNSNRILIHQI